MNENNVKYKKISDWKKTNVNVYNRELRLKDLGDCKMIGFLEKQESMNKTVKDAVKLYMQSAGIWDQYAAEQQLIDIQVNG